MQYAAWELDRDFGLATEQQDIRVQQRAGTSWALDLGKAAYSIINISSGRVQKANNCWLQQNNAYRWMWLEVR